eukprot:IDg21666t1
MGAIYAQKSSRFDPPVE